MKITIYIRPCDSGNNMTMRVDAKYESYDSPMIQRYGRKLMDALEGTTDKHEREHENKGGNQ